jgi:hypothetical protein
MSTLKADIILSPTGGRPPGFVQPNGLKLGKIISEVYTPSLATSSTAMVDLWTFQSHPGFNPNSILEFYYHIPTRNDGAGWGGAYFEPFISFDGGATEYSLGTCGHDGGVMCIGGDMIHYYNNLVYITPPVTGDGEYAVRVRFRFAAYDQTITVNGSHDLNGGGSPGPFFTTNNNHIHHYFHYILKEWIIT